MTPLHTKLCIQLTLLGRVISYIGCENLQELYEKGKLSDKLRQETLDFGGR